MRLKLFFLILLITGSVVAQESKPEVHNQERIQQIQQSIKTVVDRQDYETASKLQKEEKIRKKMALSFKSKDYERLAQLKKELENCDCLVDESIIAPTENKNEELTNHSSEDFLFQKNKNKYRNNHFVNYFSFLPLAYIRANYTDANQITYYEDENGNYTTTNTSDQTINDLVGGGFRIGGTLFFNDMRENQNLKIGFDILFVSFTGSVDFGQPGSGIIYFSLGRPGIVLKQYLNDYSGFNLRLNVGNAFTVSNVPTVAALGIEARLSYWYKNFSFGVEYQYINNIENIESTTRINQIGLNCEFHF